MTLLAEHGLVPLAEMRGELARAARSITLRNRDGSICAFAMVDAEDYERIAQHRWSSDSNGYARRVVDRRTIKMHRVVLGLGPDDPGVDHINRNPLDNRKANLRLATQAQNCQNQSGRKTSTSRYRGVSWNVERQKWVAQATVNYRNHNLGRFDSEEEAAEAVRVFRRERMPYSIEEEA